MILCVATFMKIFIVGIFGSSVCAESEQQSHKDAGIYLLWAWYQQQSHCPKSVFSTLHLYIRLSVAKRPRREAGADIQPL